MKRTRSVHIPDKPNVPRSPCPHCGRMLDCASVIGEERPAAPTPETAQYCFAICCHCGEINTYDEKLRLRAPTPMELLRMQLDEDAWKIMKAAKLAWRLTKIQTGAMRP